MTKDVRAALGELWEVVKLSTHSTSPEVQAFGEVILGRLCALARQEFSPRMLTDTEAQPFVRMADSPLALEPGWFVKDKTQ